MDASEAVLRQIYPPDKLEEEIGHLQTALENEKLEVIDRYGFLDVIRTKEVRLALLAGVGLQVRCSVTLDQVYIPSSFKWDLKGSSRQKT